MADKPQEYPVATLHSFLEEASKEFRRFRFQATINLIGAVILLVFLARFLIFASTNYGPPPFFHDHMPTRAPFIADSVLLVASFLAVLWSFDVWFKQRKFVSRWGERFEKLEALEGQLLPDNQRPA